MNKIGYFSGGNAVISVDPCPILNNHSNEVTWTSFNYEDTIDSGGPVLNIIGTMGTDDVAGRIVVQVIENDIWTKEDEAPSYKLCQKNGSCCTLCLLSTANNCRCGNCNCSNCTCETRNITYVPNEIYNASF